MVSILNQDKTVTQGKCIIIETDHAIVIPPDDPGKPKSLALYFCMKTGRHITWGMGRHQLDDWPRLSPSSLRELQAKR